VSVELQIDRVVSADVAEATVTVRCLRGPVGRGARFDQLGGSAQAIDLELTQILVYGHDVDALDTGVTALVTLRGEDVQRLESGAPATGWQVLQAASG
jgi:hypothetical protein